jgi:hypothetical protein
MTPIPEIITPDEVILSAAKNVRISPLPLGLAWGFSPTNIACGIRGASAPGLSLDHLLTGVNCLP